MRQHHRYFLALVAMLMLAGATAAHSTTYEKIYVNVPGAIATQTWGINEAGDVVGDYKDSSGGWHGYLFSGGVYTTLDNPAGGVTHVSNINNVGQVVGTSGGQGFIYYQGTYTPIPGSSSAQGINDAGQIVGSTDNGYLYTAGTFTSLTIPGIQFTGPHDINNLGQIVGMTWTHGSQQGFYGTPGNFTLFNVPGHEGQTNAFGINDAGQIVGYNWGNNQNFLWSDGVFSTISINGETWNVNWDINNKGQICTGDNFIANPVPLPSTLLLLGSGLLGLAGVRLRFRKS